jgi:hypothetical protein
MPAIKARAKKGIFSTNNLADNFRMRKRSMQNKTKGKIAAAGLDNNERTKKTNVNTYCFRFAVSMNLV